MKKILVRLFLVLVLLLIVAVVVVGLNLGSAIKKGVETIGPQVTKVDVKLDGVNLSLFSGSSKIKGLVVGNPAGYKTAQAISVGSTSVSVSPGSVLSDKIIVRSIRVEAPQVTFELGPGGSNLQVIQANVSAATGGGTPKEKKPAQEIKTPAEAKGGKKIEVDEVVITGGKITLGAAMLGGKLVEVPLPEIRLPALGKGPDGITLAELTGYVLNAITEGAISVASQELTKMGKEALDSATKNVSEGLSNKAQGVINDLFKTKKKE